VATTRALATAEWLLGEGGKQGGQATLVSLARSASASSGLRDSQFLQPFLGNRCVARDAHALEGLPGLAQ
jgi:hypothetical protein